MFFKGISLDAGSTKKGHQMVENTDRKSVWE